MSTKLTKQERLYDVTQLAKAVFVSMCTRIDFTDTTHSSINAHIGDAFDIAETFLKEQEQYASQVNDA